MDTERMINELKNVAEKHGNKRVFTGEVNITAMCEDIIPKLEQLKRYEDLEEQGLLLRLPCKVGDYVYDIKYNNRIRRSQVTRYDMAQNIGKKYKEHIHTIFNGFHGCFPISDIGKIVFLTQAEAEEALERMEKERTVWRD